MRLSTSYWPLDESEPVAPISVGDLLRQVAAEVPDRVALVEGTPTAATRRRWTYRQLLTEAERGANRLLASFRPGERVAVWAPNIPEWVLLDYAAALAGVVLVTVNPSYRAAEVTHALRQSRSAGLFLVPDFRGHRLIDTAEQIRGELPDLRQVFGLDDWAGFTASASPAGSERPLPTVDPAAAAQLQYTSGTTGFAKGALLPHVGIVTNARLCLQRLEVGAGDVYVNPMPLFHTAGCVLAVLGCLASRATHVLVPGFDPALVLDLCEQEQATAVAGVPTMLLALLEQPGLADRDLSRLRAVLCGGATVPPELVRRIETAFGARFSTIFGQTETSPVITQTRLHDAPVDKAGTVGQPLPQTEVKIVDPVTGATVPTDTVGELCTRGYLLMRGYFELPEATAETIDADGWLHTGDLCSMDERGYCQVRGRLKDMVIRGGENVYPRELEDVLFTHPAVAEVAVVGVPDPRWGEQLAAFVRLATPAPRRGEDLSPAEPDRLQTELAELVRGTLAAHKVPRYWVWVNELPLTASGKVQKFALRDRFLAAHPELAAAAAG